MLVICPNVKSISALLFMMQLKVSFIGNFQWEVFLHDCITYLSKYLFIVLLLYRLQIKWEIKKKKVFTSSNSISFLYLLHNTSFVYSAYGFLVITSKKWE
jgi:hypothetical protein